MKRTPIYLLVFSLIFALSCDSSNSNGGGNGNGGGDDLNGYNDETFFSTDGVNILNRQGEVVIIRGYGLGGWFMPEGYMFNMPGDFGPTKLRNAITNLLGASEAERWFEVFRDNYVTEDDIIAMKEWGADHVRIPFHYDIFYDINTGEFKESGFDRINDLLVWCKRNRMDVILDMHAAPGAQNSSEISDSDGVARLWTEYETYMPITIEIWTEIARRYKDETIIIGYDLLNEPVTPDGYGAEDVLRFHVDLIPEIRAIDENHIIFVNGNYYSTTFDLLDQLASSDENMVYAFHKYWNATDQGTINYLLDLRNQTNTPLWLGETGENSNVWFHETAQLAEDNDIGWNYWTHKKHETITSPLSAPTNDNYEKVINYWKGSGAMPTIQEATDGLFQFAEDLAIANNEVRPDVIASLFSPDFGTSNMPYSDLTIPGIIPATHYDIGNQGISYYDTEYKRVSSDDNQNNGNNGWSMRNDGVDIEVSSDPLTEYNVGWTEDGEWLEYTVDVTSAGTYDVNMRIASAVSGGRFRLKVDGQPISSDISVSATGGYQAWSELSIGSWDFDDAGTVLLRLEILTGGFNISTIEFE